MRRRLVALVVGCVALGLLSACQVDGRVEVTVDDDGSGVVEVTVTLDAEAAERVPELAEQLRAGDLKERGWEITGPTPVGGDAEAGSSDTAGPIEIVATKPFASPEQLTAIMDELGEGLFEGFQLTRSRGVASTEHELTGTIDATGGLESLSDAELTELLGGQPLGFDLAALEDELGAPPASLFDLELVVALPGEDVIAEPPGEVSGQTATWTTGFDATEPVAVETASTTEDEVVRIAAFVAAVALLLLVLLLLVRMVRRRQRARKERKARRLASAAGSGGSTATPGG